MPLISAIVPTRNRAGSLADALRSIYAQDGAGVHFDLEIIVVDDASTDGTPALLRAHPTVRSIRLPVNRGVSAARNAGIRASSGRYLAFLDDDDVWLPSKLLQQLRALDAHPDAAVVYSPYLVRLPAQQERTNVYEHAPSGSILLPLLIEGNHCGAPVAVLVRRQAFDAAGGFDEDLPTAEDYDMWLRLASRFPFAFVPGPVAVHHRAREGKFARFLLAGEAGRCSRYEVERGIVERALRQLPAAPADDGIARAALAALEVRVAVALCDYGQVDRMGVHLVNAFRRTPWFIRYPRTRNSIAYVWARFALGEHHPISVTHAFCRELRGAARGQGLKQWAWTRRLLGSIWMELARCLHSAGERGPAAHAAARAVAANPLLLGRRSLARLIAQVGRASPRRARASRGIAS